MTSNPTVNTDLVIDELRAIRQQFDDMEQRIRELRSLWRSAQYLAAGVNPKPGTGATVLVAGVAGDALDPMATNG